MTREALLKASITEFEDNKKNAEVYQCRRVPTDSGYVYLIKDRHSRRKISCAIHWNASFEIEEAIGKYENNDVSINTRERLEFDTIIEYNGLLISITSQDDYNETMAQWHYNGTASFKPISDKFFITDESEIDKKIGINSLAILIPLDLGFPIVPSYYSASAHKQYIMIDVENSESLTPIYKQGDELVQYKKDSIRMSFINLNTHEVMSVVKKLQDYAVLPDIYKFSINGVINLYDQNVFQKSFEWKSLSYATNFEVNYYLKSYTDEESKIIRDALFTAIMAI